MQMKVPRPGLQISITTRWLLAVVLLVFLSMPGFAQDKGQPVDTAKHIRSISDAYGNLEVRDQQLPVTGNDTTIRILENIQSRTIRLEELKTILANRLDTTDMRETLPRYMGMTDMLVANAKENAGKLNMRYLMGLEVLVNTMWDNTNDYCEQIRNKTSQLKEVEKSLEKLKPDSSLQPNARNALALSMVSKDINTLDSSARSITLRYREQRVILANYQTTVSELQIKLLELRNLILAEKKNTVASLWDKEINNAWEKRSYPTGEWRRKLSMSNGLNGKILGSYVERTVNQSAILISIILAIGLLVLYFLRKKTPKIHNGGVIPTRARYFHRHPFFSSIVLALPFSYFIYSDMPVPFVACLTFLLVLCSLPLALQKYGQKMDIALIAGMPIYLFLSYIRLNWETVLDFRWIVLVMSLGSLALGVFVWIQSERERPEEKKDGILKWISGFLILMSAIAIAGNLLGRYNVAKVYSTTGIVGFYRGIGLYFFVQVALEAMYMLLEASKSRNDNAATVVEYQEFHDKIKYVLSLFAFLSWTYFTLLYLGWLDPMVIGTTEFLQKNRKVGDMQFTYGAIALFIGILMLSSILANWIAYFTSLREQRATITRKNRIGSSVLLIRLGILTGGFLLAIAATKIPIDRITIVLGALSVGIGFGLQNIIDNLASGIILALEKPIQIGDQVEVGNKSGTVKEIGIRSSRIRASDGSDIVFPNSQLISQGLVNWTLKDSFKKVELIVGVANGSDPTGAKQVLEEIIATKDVMKTPAPKVSFDDLDKYSVKLKVQFWVKHPGEAGARKSEIIADIVQRFGEKGIRMPEKES
jgi:potassium efflux system protein